MAPQTLHSPSSSDTIIRVERLTVGFDEETVLQNVSFDVHRGEVLVILGGSGCGKSTLLKNMIGLFQPMQGQILIEGDDIVTAEGQARKAILRKIGVMFQSGALFGSMSLRENVRLALEEYTNLPREAADLIVSMKLYQVGLHGYGSKMPAELSGGMQKRAAIARAMVMDPQILFLDEPSAGLDPITAADLDELIVSLSQNLAMTFVIATHELPSVFAVADRAIMLDKKLKKIVATGNPWELRQNTDHPLVYQFFHRNEGISHKKRRTPVNPLPL